MVRCFRETANPLASPAGRIARKAFKKGSTIHEITSTQKECRGPPGRGESGGWRNLLG